MSKRIAQRCASRRQLVRFAHLREPMLLSNKMKHQEGAAALLEAVSYPLACACVLRRACRLVVSAVRAGGGPACAVMRGASGSVGRATSIYSRGAWSSQSLSRAMGRLLAGGRSGGGVCRRAAALLNLRGGALNPVALMGRGAAQSPFTSLNWTGRVARDARAASFSGGGVV